MEVSEPSKMGELVRPVAAVLAQSQYCAHLCRSTYLEPVARGFGSQWTCVSTYRLCTLVATLIPERFLIHPGEVTVPCQEVACVVDVQGLVDVSGHIVVEASLGTRGDVGRSPGRLALETLDCVDVGLAFLLGKGAPEKTKASNQHLSAQGDSG